MVVDQERLEGCRVEVENMAKYTGAKCRYCRAEKMQLYLKGDRCSSGKCPLRKEGGKRSGIPGSNPKIKVNKKITDYAIQLREKQKLKRMYGMLEKQFHLTYLKASKMSGVTGANIIELLERRLDNVCYRLHFGKSRAQARALVNHGHVFVNGRRVDIASYQVKNGDVISIRKESQNSSVLKANLEEYAKKQNNTVSWLSLDTTSMTGTFNSDPVKAEIADLEKVNEQLIVELYSK